MGVISVEASRSSEPNAWVNAQLARSTLLEDGLADLLARRCPASIRSCACNISAI